VRNGSSTTRREVDVFLLGRSAVDIILVTTTRRARRRANGSIVARGAARAGGATVRSRVVGSVEVGLGVRLGVVVRVDSSVLERGDN